VALLARPAPCRLCVLDSKAEGFAPADGPSSAWLLLVGEALGKVEALTGRPFMGDAGGMLTRLLNLLGWTRDAIRIHNVISCFPASTIVQAPGLQRAFSRGYSGVMVTVMTRQGDLTGTLNHPVLTARGWQPLGKLQPGDHLIRYNGSLQGSARRDPDVQHVPASIAQVFQSAADARIGRRVISSSVDFHGDGMNSQVEIVAVDGMLRRDHQSPILQLLLEQLFEPANAPRAASGASIGLASDLFERELLASQSRMSGGRKTLSTSVPFAPHTQSSGLGLRSTWNVEEFERSPHATMSEMQPTLDLFGRFAPQVELCEVMRVAFAPFDGLVYNLETSSHKYLANGYIVHNCRPPGDWFDEKAPWYRSALGYCPYLEATLSEGHAVVVPMGATALRRVLRLEHVKKIRVQDFHGSVLRDPTDRFWVVPTYHPSYLQRGAHNLIGTVVWDLRQAEQARSLGKPADNASLVIDPPIDWFRQWVDLVVAARTQDRDAYPISSDVETPDKASGKDEGEITTEDRSFQVLRQNVACHPDEGVTVPYEGPYIAELQRLHASPGPIWEWNREYDFQRQVQNGQLQEADSHRVVDLMRLAHFLQSDLPQGLGFWAPFYSSFGPWKHLADSDPARYGAGDALQNHRCGFGVISDLIQQQRYVQAMRHTHRRHVVALRPAQLVGVKVDRQRLQIFKADLVEKARTRLQAIQLVVPDSLQPLTPKGGLVKKPLADVLHVKASAFTRKGKVRAGRPVTEIKQELYAKAILIEKIVLKEVLVCQTCGAVDVQRRHRCRARGEPGDSAPRTTPPGPPTLTVAPASVTRWFWKEPFNPDSWQQVLAYIKYRKHRPGRAKKSIAQESTDRETLNRLVKTKDPFYPLLLDYRAVVKVKGTYAEGTERRLDAEDRLHPVPTQRPSMYRLSYVDPNITNVVADKGGKEGLAAGFRKCIVAVDSCKLMEIDFSAIEAVETGWCGRDPRMMRLARLGIHSWLIAQRMNDAPDLTAPDVDIRRHLKQVKQTAGDLLYDQIKHTVYAVLYGSTAAGLFHTWPMLYPSIATAEELVQFMFHHLPSVQTFQQRVMDQAATLHYLGGPGDAGPPVDHPFGYKHWFWNVYTYKRLNRAQELRLQVKYNRLAGAEPPILYIQGQPFKIARGTDANRAIAFFPQSIAAGVLAEVELRLFDPDSPSYIGDAYFGRTPLRAPIHDSLLLEVPFRQWDRVYEKVCLEMQRPIVEQPNDPAWGLGPSLQIGIAAKAGADWQDTEEIEVPGFEAIDELGSPMELDDEEDWEDLSRVV